MSSAGLVLISSQLEKERECGPRQFYCLGFIGLELRLFGFTCPAPRAGSSEKPIDWLACAVPSADSPPSHAPRSPRGGSSVSVQSLLSSTIRATILGRQVYLVPRDDGEIVVGATVREDGLDGIHAGGVHELLEDAITVLPALRHFEIADITARARPVSPDDIPYVGLIPKAPGILVSAGYSRHGILLAPLGARLGAALLSGEMLSSEDAELLAAMNPGRIEREAAPNHSLTQKGPANGNHHR